MKYSCSKEAKEAAIKHYDGFCIMSGLSKRDTSIAGCHIFPAGAYPELKTWSENILPIRFSLHTNADNTFDWITFQKKARSPNEKIYWLIKNGIRPEFKRKVRSQLYDLADILAKHERHIQNAYILKTILENDFE